MTAVGYLGDSLAADLAAHEADTTSVHGIANTALLETTAGAQAKADAAQAAAISAAATDATTKANAAQAAAVQRANHTGTQSADTLTDGTTNKAFLATERTKLAGVATGATANSSDATLLARANHTGSQATSTITGLDAALAARATFVDYWVNVQKAAGIAYDGVTDDSAAYQALLDSIPAAAGNEIGGVGLFHPHGVMLLNTPVSSALGSTDTIPNITIAGTGAGSRIRTSTANTTDLFRFTTATNLAISDILFQVLGTARITNAINLDCGSPGSMHNVRLRNVTISCNGTFRNAFDVSSVSGSPVVYSAQAEFAAGDVGGTMTLNFSTGPLYSAITAVSTLSGTLAADMNTSTTTLTLTAPIAGAPASGWTLNAGGTERMLVTAGGDTTTLTVTRGRGLTQAGVGVAHTAGESVLSYSATLADNAPLTVSNAIIGSRIQPSGTAIMQNGIAIGTGSPGASNLDIAGVIMEAISVTRPAVAAINCGNGTAGNNLIHTVSGLEVSEGTYAVYANGGDVNAFGLNLDGCVVGYKRNMIADNPLVWSGGRVETVGMLYQSTGAITSGQPTAFRDIAIPSMVSEDGLVISHLLSAPLILENISIRANTTSTPQIAIVAQGTAAAPCTLTAINVGAASGNGDIFSSSAAPTCVKTIIGAYRMNAAGVLIASTVAGTEFGQRAAFKGGMVRSRTTVADAAYTVLTSDQLVVYTSLTASRVVNLPAQGSTLLAGQEFIIKDESGNCAGGVTLTITPPSGTIDGAASLVLNTAYAKATVYTNGTNWFTR